MAEAISHSSKENINKEKNVVQTESCVQSPKELSKGILHLYQDEIKPIEEHVKELIQNQGVLRDITQNEITQVKESIMLADITKTFDTMKIYHKKLVTMKKDMNNLSVRIDKFKIRAQKLQLQKERQELEAAQEREKQRKYEKELTAKPAFAVKQTSPTASSTS